MDRIESWRGGAPAVEIYIDERKPENRRSVI